MSLYAFHAFLLVLGASSTSGLDGPIDELYGYAEQQEAFLGELGSYIAEIRQAREVFRVGTAPGEAETTVSLETLLDRTIINGNRFTTRTTDFRGYASDKIKTYKHTFSYLSTPDFIAEYAHDEALPRIKVQRFEKDLTPPRRALQMKSLMNPLDLLVHGFGDGYWTLRGVCENLKQLAEAELITIEKSSTEGGLLIYSFYRNGAKFEVLDLDPSRMGMVTRTQLYHPEVGGLRLEVRVVLGKLPDGRPFPISWHHVTYGAGDNETYAGRLVSITRNELMKIEVGTIGKDGVSLQTFGLPDSTMVVVREGESDLLATGFLHGTDIVLEDGEP